MIINRRKIRATLGTRTIRRRNTKSGKVRMARPAVRVRQIIHRMLREEGRI